MDLKLRTLREPVLFTVVASVMCMNNVHAQDSAAARFSAGTEYSLLGTDSVEFGPGIVAETKSALLFKLSTKEEVNAETGESGTTWSGNLAFDRIDFMSPREVRMYDLTDGFSYSAGFGVESSDDFDSQSEIISSRQLGIHYGRLGPDNYNALDVSFRHFSSDVPVGNAKAEDAELWSLGVTTGRRFSLTGLDASDPLWTVSLRGQFNVIESDKIEEALENQQWYVSPGLQWRSDSFKLSADVLMPFMQSGELEEESDYRIRAKIQKQF